METELDQQQIDQLAEDLFKYHAPTPEQVEKYARINEAAKTFFKVVHAECPPSPDRTAAVRNGSPSRRASPRRSSSRKNSGGLDE
jgi:hypothetical protein